MQETYQAVIVEDDPMIASIDQNFLERDPRFRLAASFRSGQDALPWLLRHPADLLILDVYMPRMTGLELLRELRYQGNNLNQLTVMARQGRITQVNYEPFTEVYRNAWQTLNSLLSHAV